MYRLRLFLFFLNFILVTGISNSQVPSNDPAWIPQPSFSEEFNDTLDYTTKWNAETAPGWGAAYRYPNNLDQSSDTTLKIWVDTLIPGIDDPNSLWHFPAPGLVTYVYQGASIVTRQNNYQFGFIEISAKLPTSGGYSLWPAFWLYSSDCSTFYYDEIDIMENGGYESFLGNQIGTNIHLFIDCVNITNNPEVINTGVSLSSAFHKYAIEWWPNKMIFYFDDTPIRIVSDLSGVSIPQHAMSVILNFDIFPWNAFVPTNWNSFTPDPKLPTTNLPISWEINYLRYYTLDSECNTPLILCNITDYNRKIKKSITTNITCTPTYNPSTSNNSYTLRATDFVMLDEGTTIDPTGTGYFAIDIIECP